MLVNKKPDSSNGITFADIVLLDIRFVKFFFEVQEEYSYLFMRRYSVKETGRTVNPLS